MDELLDRLLTKLSLDRRTARRFLDVLYVIGFLVVMVISVYILIFA